MVLASDNLTHQPPPYSSITRDYDRNRSITLRLVIRRPVLTIHNFLGRCHGRAVSLAIWASPAKNTGVPFSVRIM
jgi:hypothetical protein